MKTPSAAMPALFPPIQPDDLDRLLQTLSDAFAAGDARAVELAARVIPWPGLRGALARSFGYSAANKAWGRAASSLCAFAPRLAKRLGQLHEDLVEDDSVAQEAFHHQTASLFDALERAPGVCAAFRDAFLAHSLGCLDDSKACPSFLAFLTRSLLSERSAQGERVLGKTLVFCVHESWSNPSLLSSVAAFLPPDALASPWWDEAIVALGAHNSHLGFFSGKNEFADLAERTRKTLEIMVHAAWLDEKILSRALSSALLGHPEWSAGAHPELAMEIARALHGIAPGLPEWPRWIAAAPVAAADAEINRGFGRRWAPVVAFFKQLSAERERLALLGPDAAGAALAPRDGSESRAPRL
jgi:hypothetical protein